MIEPRITGLNLALCEPDRSAGIVARFACVIGPVRLTGCRLKIGEDGRLRAILPRCRPSSGSIRFVDGDDFLRLTDAAVAAFRALGGTLPAHRDP